MLEYLKLQYGDFLLFDSLVIIGPISNFWNSAECILKFTIDSGLTTQKFYFRLCFFVRKRWNGKESQNFKQPHQKKMLNDDLK